MNELILLGFLCLFALIVCILWFKNKQLIQILTQNKELLFKLNLELDTTKTFLEQEKERLNTLKKDHESMIKNLEEKHQKEKKELKLENQNTLEKVEQNYQENLQFQEKKYQELLEKTEEKMKLNLKEQNEKILNQNKLMLNEDSKKILDEIFKPIKEKVEEYSKNLLQNESVLKTNIENVFKYSQNMSENAEKLSKILKGEKKLRGNFAELQLKSVLEHSGLIENEQYQMQAHFKDEDKSFYPDAVVYLDKDKCIVIDSKFSLPNDFEIHENSIDERICLQLANNLKARIDELSRKPYQKFSSFTYEYTLLFIPYSNILDLALSADNTLYQYAYSKNIYLTTPHTLFMALKTINITWTHIQSDDRVQKAFEELGKFFDKFVGFCDDFESFKKSLNSLNSSFEKMQTKLIKGSGNLASRFQNLKELGAKTSKSIQLHFEQNDLAKLEEIKENISSLELKSPKD
ncbi:DNA recombination protein RmuC [Campylobacter sp. MIT 99-7217]|uniref:DNA recombination protein RmuC n=1 Tax=Campylobacter sp. MIT 99-7217 TaxID=535091 RepID=UPI0011584921|nr:DNA recombination protein RmuC [Campylobacter sp. MIT 99-7217]TQR32985.1 DNA recombination protein RmuC [Campylobacter sp. MIT 99-7217]